MDIGLLVVQLIHILGGVIWLGGSIFMNFVVFPAILAQPWDRQRDLFRRVILGPERLMVWAALATAIMGIVRGTIYGPVRSIEALGTQFGIVWIAAVLITAAVFVVGARVTSPAARTLLDDDSVWSPSAQGPPSDSRAPAIDRVRFGFRLELIGILAVLVLMPNLRLS
jgi:uncharacterized membrane protein